MARPRVVATTWLHRDGDHILAVLSHRSPLWFLPGGKSEPGESLVQATAREVLEEIGVRRAQRGRRLGSAGCRTRRRRSWASACLTSSSYPAWPISSTSSALIDT
jgi:8-oxo-dGTP pyrophosphatase MutT (NUDIX family)